jgi:hypothetical protein
MVRIVAADGVRHNVAVAFYHVALKGVAIGVCQCLGKEPSSSSYHPLPGGKVPRIRAVELQVLVD